MSIERQVQLLAQTWGGQWGFPGTHAVLCKMATTLVNIKVSFLLFLACFPLSSPLIAFKYLFLINIFFILQMVYLLCLLCLPNVQRIYQLLESSDLSILHTPYMSKLSIKRFSSSNNNSLGATNSHNYIASIKDLRGYSLVIFHISS